MAIWQDVRLAIRLLVKDRWFTAVAALALSLGIGVNTTVFTFANAIVLRGLPLTDPDSIVSIGMTDARGRQLGVSKLDFLDWRDAARSFTHLGVLTGATLNVSEEGRAAEQYFGTYNSSNFFELIGQRPQLGRDFARADDEPGSEPVVILSDSVWKSRYAADPKILGHVVKVNDRLFTVIGVMAPEMKFPFNNDMWFTFAMLPPPVQQAKRSVRKGHDGSEKGYIEPTGHVPARGVTLAYAKTAGDPRSNKRARRLPLPPSTHTASRSDSIL